MSEIRELAYTTREAAQRLGVSESTVRNYVKRGLLPAYRMGNRLLISRQAVEEMIERVRETLSPEPLPLREEHRAHRDRALVTPPPSGEGYSR